MTLPLTYTYYASQCGFTTTCINKATSRPCWIQHCSWQNSHSVLQRPLELCHLTSSISDHQNHRRFSSISLFLQACVTSKYSNALRTSQTCSFTRSYHILYPTAACEASWSCARCGIKPVHYVTLHPSLNQCWKTFLFEYLAAIRYAISVFLSPVGQQQNS